MDPYRQPAAYVTAPPPDPGGYPTPALPGYPHACYQYPPQYRPPSTARGNPCLNCVCIMILLTVLIGCLISTIIYTFFLNAEPPSIRVESLAVSGLNASNASISGIWDVGLTIRNRDHRLHAYYEEAEIRLVYASEVIGWGHLTKFDQAKKTQDLKTVKVTAFSSYLDPGKVSDLNSEKAKGSFMVGLEVWADTRFEFSRLFHNRVTHLESECNDLSVGIMSGSAEGKMSDGSKDCYSSLRRGSRFWWL